MTGISVVLGRNSPTKDPFKIEPFLLEVLSNPFKPALSALTRIGEILLTDHGFGHFFLRDSDWFIVEKGSVQIQKTNMSVKFIVRTQRDSYYFDILVERNTIAGAVFKNVFEIWDKLLDPNFEKDLPPTWAWNTYRGVPGGDLFMFQLNTLS